MKIKWRPKKGLHRILMFLFRKFRWWPNKTKENWFGFFQDFSASSSRNHSRATNFSLMGRVRPAKWGLGSSVLQCRDFSHQIQRGAKTQTSATSCSAAAKKFSRSSQALPKLSDWAWPNLIKLPIRWNKKVSLRELKIEAQSGVCRQSFTSCRVTCKTAT